MAVGAWWVCERSGSGCGMLASVRFGRLAGDDLVVVPVLGPVEGVAVLLGFFEVFDVHPGQEGVQGAGRNAEAAGSGVQSFAVTEQVRGGVAVGPERGADGVPGQCGRLQPQ